MSKTIQFNTGRKYTAQGQIITATLHDDGVVTFFDHSRGIDGQYVCQLPFAFSSEQVMDYYDNGKADGTQRSWADGMLRGGCNTRKEN